MTQQPNGLYQIVIGKEIIFTDLEYNEALSGLLTVTDYYEGIACFAGFPIWWGYNKHD